MLSRSPGCSTRLFELLKGLVKNWWASDTSLKDNAMEASDATNSFVQNHAGVSDQVRLRPPAGLVSRPRDRVELRQALRQPVLAERSGRPVPSLQGLERLLPLPVCKYARSRRDKRFRGDGPSAPPSRRSTTASRC